MKFLTLTQNQGKTTVYVNEEMIAVIEPAQSGGGSSLILSGATGFYVDQTPAQILAML